MSRVIIDLHPALEERLAREAARSGLSRDECARTALERGLTRSETMPEGPQDLGALAANQRAPRAVHFEDLLGDFWPEDESADEFIATLRSWRREDSQAAE